MEVKNEVIRTSGLRKLELLEKLEDKMMLGLENTNVAISSIADALATINTGTDNGLVINVLDSSLVTITDNYFTGLETGLKIHSKDVGFKGTNQFDTSKAGIQVEGGSSMFGDKFQDDDYEDEDRYYDENYGTEEGEALEDSSSPEASQASRDS